MIYVRLTCCCINRVLSLLLPAAFFAALDTDFSPSGTTDGTFSSVSDETRGKLLKISRGIAVLLLIVWVSGHFSRSHILIYSLFSYVCSRLYLHNPPGKSDELTRQVTAPLILSQKEKPELPEVNQWICLAMLIICIGLMAVTAEWVGGLLTDS
jgi:Ca2+:H+ antiporter